MDRPEFEVNNHNLGVGDDVVRIEQHSELLDSEPIANAQSRQTEVGADNQPAKKMD